MIAVKWWQVAGAGERAAALLEQAERKTAEEHKKIKEISLFNQARVLKAFQLERIADDHFSSNEGYGYNDPGRDKLEALYARVFGGDDAIVRPHFVSGTHAIFVALKGLLKPGDKLVSVTGAPYDTLQRAIVGRRTPPPDPVPAIEREGTLQDWGISFLPLSTEKLFSPRGGFPGDFIKEAQAIFIQRSRGYDPDRRSLRVEEIGHIIERIRRYNRRAAVLVDNCYGEFVEKEEPLEAGADLLAGSLIKNPGGGLAPTGGYIVGRGKLVETAAAALSAPGLGRELGAFIFNKRLYFQGLFAAPHQVAEALRGAVTAASALESAGYEVDPRPGEERGDIVQSVKLASEGELHKFCGAVQKASPVNSHVTPVAGKTAGYSDPIFMAAGTFVQGSSSEFSADAPLRRPYTAYLQGGLSYEHVVLGVASILDAVGESG